MLYIALLFVIFLAGCLDDGRTTTEIKSKDMLTIKSIDIFPSKDLQPGDTIIVRMEVENVGQESTHLLVDKSTSDSKALDWNGDYLLIDHCPSLYNANSNAGLKDADFQILSGGTCATLCDPADSACKIPQVGDSDGVRIGGTACYLKIPSGQSHTFQWSMKAPSTDKIADMTHKCTFKFQIAYASKAVTNTYVYFADPIEVAQRIYTKKDMSLVGDNIASYGPVAVNFETAEPQPIPARTNSDGTPEKWTVFLNLRNVGTGLTDVSAIDLLRPEGVELIGSKILGCNGLNVVDKNLALVDAMTESGTFDIASFRGALSGYVGSCDPSRPYTPPQSCDAEILALATEYNNNLCPSSPNQPEADDLACSMTFSEVRTALADTKRLLQIYSQTSSRIPCELTIPTGVVILTPFRFVTTADYTYGIRQDIPITTKPIK